MPLIQRTDKKTYIYHSVSKSWEEIDLGVECTIQSGNDLVLEERSNKQALKEDSISRNLLKAQESLFDEPSSSMVSNGAQNEEMKDYSVRARRSSDMQGRSLKEAKETVDFYKQINLKDEFVAAMREYVF